MHRYILNNSDPHPQLHRPKITQPRKVLSVLKAVGAYPQLLQQHFGPLGGNNQSGRGKPSQEFHFTSALSHFLPNRNLSNVLRTPPGRGKLPHFTCKRSLLILQPAQKCHPPGSAASVNIPYPRIAPKYSEIRLPKDAAGAPCR